MFPFSYSAQMQALLRERGADTMHAADDKKFKDVYEQGKLVAPEDAGHVAAALALRAPKSLSGRFVSWDADECKEFRRQ